MEIRELGVEDIERAMYMSSQAFMHGRRVESTPQQWLENPKRPSSTVYGVWDEGGLQAKVNVNHYRQQFGCDSVIKMGGLAGVVCLPASRGRGYAGACVRHSLEQMRANGEYVSTLFPFSYAFYRALGWGWVGVKRRYTVQSRDLNASSDSGVRHVYAVGPTERERVVDVYTRFAYRYRGMILRPDNHWAAILDDGERDHTFTYLYIDPESGGPEGYLTVRGGSKDNTAIREFLCLSPRAQRALLGLLHRCEMQVDSFSWEAPGDDLLWNQGYDWHVKTQIEPLTMGRIVDVPGALAAWKPAGSTNGRAVIEVLDTHAPWNSGAWKVEAEAGNVRVDRSALKADVSMDIETLSQAFYGAPSLAELRAAERISVHNESGYEVLDSVLHGPGMYMSDSF